MDKKNIENKTNSIKDELELFRRFNGVNKCYSCEHTNINIPSHKTQKSSFKKNTIINKAKAKKFLEKERQE